MKWFRYNSDSYTNLKIQSLIQKYGMNGYGVFWIACELVAQQGNDYHIPKEKDWTSALQAATHLRRDQLTRITEFLARIHLIDEKAYFDKGVLYIPKMQEYSDDYSKRVRRVSEQGTDNVRENPSTVHNTTLHNTTLQTSPKITKVKFEPIDMELSRKLLSLIRGNTPTFKEPNLDNWAENIRLMRERDERTVDQIQWLIEWSQKDNFWAANILSTSKLREKFDQLVSQAKRDKTNKREVIL